MTRTQSARLAGFAYLSYIAVAFPGMLLFGRASAGVGGAERLASIATHAPDVRLAALLSLLGCFAALMVAVGLYGVTRDEDHELATLAMACRTGEGIIAGVMVVAMLGLLWLATARGSTAPDAASANVLAMLLIKVRGWSESTSATFFAVGSTIFCWLLVRGRMIPVPLAWLGLVSSALLAVLIPLELVGITNGNVIGWMFLPMGGFEVVAGVWLLLRGVAPLVKSP
ncbi:MAG: hypothetical protein JWO05_918 [Gemmatimonadetes bacterium]|nr:hypothetical protein [Gemmatimonadota bacterium]